MRFIIHNSKFLIPAGLILVAGLAAYFFTAHNDNVQMFAMTVGNAEIKVEVADEVAEQFQGLSDRDHLCARCGMVFVFESPALRDFVMRRMQFPLDMIFIADGRVVEIRDNVPHPAEGEEPTFVTSTYAADMVLEVNAGWAAQNNLKTGDRATVDPAPRRGVGVDLDR